MLDAQAPQQPAADRPRITTRYMTKYERARVLGTRALQIRYVHLLVCASARVCKEGHLGQFSCMSLAHGLPIVYGCSMNAPVMVNLDGETDPLEVRKERACHRVERIRLLLQPARTLASLLLRCHLPQIAMKELREKKVPFTIRRYLPDGRCVALRCISAYHQCEHGPSRARCVRTSISDDQ